MNSVEVLGQVEKRRHSAQYSDEEPVVVVVVVVVVVAVDQRLMRYSATRESEELGLQVKDGADKNWVRCEHSKAVDEG
jgi:hypothetical protein